MKSRLNVVCIIEKDGKILLGKKAPGVGPYVGCWLIPGGGVNEDGESIDAAMKREMKEETNLEVTEFERLYFDEDIAERHGEMMRLIYLYYKITNTVEWKSLKSGDDLEVLEWFSFAQLTTIDIPPISITTFRKLGYIK
jgi:ADP-ribose pyrophosphatase YjhB (NUDIX family)